MTFYELTKLPDSEFTEIWLNHKEVENCVVCHARRARRRLGRELGTNKSFNVYPNGVSMNERNRAI